MLSYVTIWVVCDFGCDLVLKRHFNFNLPLICMHMYMHHSYVLQNSWQFIFTVKEMDNCHNSSHCTKVKPTVNIQDTAAAILHF